MSIIEQMEKDGWHTFKDSFRVRDNDKFYITSYQKRFRDEFGTKYFINCEVNDYTGALPSSTRYSYSFTSQFADELDNHLNIETVAWKFVEDKYDTPICDLNRVKETFDKLWLALGSIYYEKDAE